jgi:uncharacterized membrane protein YkoI
MISRFTTLAIAAALLTVIPAAVPARAQQSCIADWSVAAPIVRREGLATMERVGRIMREGAAMEIVKSALCTANGRYVYRLTVRGGSGLRTLVVDARQPRLP